MPAEVVQDTEVELLRGLIPEVKGYQFIIDNTGDGGGQVREDGFGILRLGEHRRGIG